MLSIRFPIRWFSVLLLGLGVLGAGGPPLVGQESVAILRGTAGENAAPRPRKNARGPAAAGAQSFTLSRNLIFFRAEVNGRAGTFILDTGAPTLLVNHRGGGDNTGRGQRGRAAGGDVTVTDRLVRSFSMRGRRVENYWALGLDLRSMERRTGRRIDGYVGYDLINRGELRIDYAAERFQLNRSVRRPRHAGQPPRLVLPFTLSDHLPVVALRCGDRTLRFILDTGAGASLLDPRYATDPAIARPTARTFNIQGLDGAAGDHPVVTLPLESDLVLTGPAPAFVSYGLAHLQDGDREIAGILGSDFLQRFTVGIDYRRRRIYLW